MDAKEAGGKGGRGAVRFSPLRRRRSFVSFRFVFYFYFFKGLKLTFTCVPTYHAYAPSALVAAKVPAEDEAYDDMSSKHLAATGFRTPVDLS